MWRLAQQARQTYGTTKSAPCMHGRAQPQAKSLADIIYSNAHEAPAYLNFKAHKVDQ